MAEEHLLCRLDDLPESQSKGFAISADARYADILVVRTRAGIYAYRNRCPHTGAPMEWEPDQSSTIAAHASMRHSRRVVPRRGWLLRDRTLRPAILQRIAVISAMAGWSRSNRWTEQVIAEPVIQVEDLCKHYGVVRAVDGISFTVARGATCALLGGNGAGKTTTIAMLLGLLLPTGGHIRILGEEVPRHRSAGVAAHELLLALLDLPQRLTVAENLTVYARLYGVRRIRERLGDAGPRSGH